MAERFRENPQRPEAGDCCHGNKEATCPECLKDIEVLNESLKKARKPSQKPKTTEQR